jgi:hypothetical protein
VGRKWIEVGLRIIYDLGNTLRLDNGLGRTSPPFPFFSFCFSFFSFLLSQYSNRESSYGECLPGPAPYWGKSLRSLSRPHGAIFPETLAYRSKLILAFPKISISILTTFQLDKPCYLAIGATIATTTGMGSSSEWAPKSGIVADVLGDAGYTIANEHTIPDEHVVVSRWRHMGTQQEETLRRSSMCARERIINVGLELRDQRTSVPARHRRLHDVAQRYRAM